MCKVYLKTLRQGRIIEEIGVFILVHGLALWDVVKCADYIVDLGPEGGNEGGNVIFEGTPEEIIKCKESYTGQYLRNLLNS